MLTTSQNLRSDSRPKLTWGKQSAQVIAMIGAVAIVLVCAKKLGWGETMALIIDLVIVGYIPAAGWALRRQVRNRNAPLMPRLKRYRYLIVNTWALGLAAFAGFADRNIEAENQGFSLQNLRSLGFQFQSQRVLFGWCLVLGVGSAAIGWLFYCLRARGWLRPAPWDLVPIPETRSEKLVCLLLLAPSVGLCEEVVYRGYLLNEIPHRLTGCPVVVSLLLSSLLFGLAHMASHLGGTLQTFLLGALFAWPVVYSGTLYPSIVIHTLYDAVALLWIRPRLVRKAASSSPSPT